MPHPDQKESPRNWRTKYLETLSQLFVENSSILTWYQDRKTQRRQAEEAKQHQEELLENFYEEIRVKFREKIQASKTEWRKTHIGDKTNAVNALLKVNALFSYSDDLIKYRYEVDIRRGYREAYENSDIQPEKLYTYDPQYAFAKFVALVDSHWIEQPERIAELLSEQAITARIYDEAKKLYVEAIRELEHFFGNTFYQDFLNKYDPPTNRKRKLKQ